MDCRICKRDIGMTIVILPIKQDDGTLEILACLDCAKQSSAYCNKHNRPHLGFEDRSTACTACINEEVFAKRDLAHGIYNRILDDLSAEEFEEIVQAAYVTCVITGDLVEVAVLRYIITKAQRKKMSHEQVVELLLQEDSATVILQ